MKINHWFLILVLWPLLGAANDKTLKLFNIDTQIHDNTKQVFIPHHGEGRFGSYLAMNINYPPILQLLKQLQQSEGQLNARGEAHITVLTPIEYFDVLRNKLTIEQIDQVARAQDIQASQFKLVCLGRGQAILKSGWQQTYFVVVKSEALLKLRQTIQALYIKHGGVAKDFEPTEFYPHITVGFSERDLHLSDGVIKDKQACYAQVGLKE